MVLNIGYIELGGGGVDIKVYYDTTWQINNPTADPNLAPLIDGPRGFCLDVTNTTGSNVHLEVDGLKGNPTNLTFGQGDPVTTGNGRSRTAAQMNNLGFTTRGDVGAIILTDTKPA